MRTDCWLGFREDVVAFFSGFSEVIRHLIHTLWHSRIGEIRLFILLGLAGWFSDPFCHAA
jgi:hypothetical protein